MPADIVLQRMEEHTFIVIYVVVAQSLHGSIVMLVKDAHKWTISVVNYHLFR